MSGVTRAFRRISLETERSGSIQKQGERLSAYEVSQGRDPALIQWYDDRNVSGSRDVKRPERDRLMRDVSRGDRVICTKVDRMARNVRDLLDIVAHIQDAGASVVFVDNNLNTDGPYGRFMLLILAAIAELEASIIGERQRESRESFLSNGRHPAGKLPLGFQTVPNPDGRVGGLVVRPHPIDGPKVVEAIDRILAGETQDTVRESLGLSKTGIHKLLYNPRLAGMVPENGGVVTRDGVPLVNAQAALITVAKWRELQEHLATPSVKNWSKQTGLGRALSCGVCGERMYRQIDQRSERYTTYKCRRVKHKKGQHSPTITAHIVEAHISADFLKRFGKQAYAVVSWRDNDAEKLEALALNEIQVEEIQRRMKAAFDPEVITALAQQLIEAHKQRAEIEATKVERTRAVVQTGQTLAQVWEGMSDAEREAQILTLGSYTLGGARGMPLAERVLWAPHEDAPGLSLSQALRSLVGEQPLTDG